MKTKVKKQTKKEKMEVIDSVLNDVKTLTYGSIKQGTEEEHPLIEILKANVFLINELCKEDYKVDVKLTRLNCTCDCNEKETPPNYLH